MSAARRIAAARVGSLNAMTQSYYRVTKTGLCLAPAAARPFQHHRQEQSRLDDASLRIWCSERNCCAWKRQPGDSSHCA